MMPGSPGLAYMRRCPWLSTAGARPPLYQRVALFSSRTPDARSRCGYPPCISDASPRAVTRARVVGPLMGPQILRLSARTRESPGLFDVSQCPSWFVPGSFQTVRPYHGTCPPARLKLPRFNQSSQNCRHPWNASKPAGRKLETKTPNRAEPRHGRLKEIIRMPPPACPLSQIPRTAGPG